MKKSIVKKWYRLLRFPIEYDERFYALLDSIDCTRFTSVTSYDETQYSPIENLFAFLYFCEDLELRYQRQGIPQTVLFDTLQDIVIWTSVHLSVHGELGLSEISWLKRHLSFRLFKLGRLQYCMAHSEFDIPSVNLKKGEPVVEVHIPEGESLLLEKCQSSLALAQAFFAQYFPDYAYDYYTCHSWLLAPSVLAIIDKTSNIANFQTLFHLAHNDISDALLRYTFRWDTTRENLNDFPAKSSLAKAIKAEIEKGTLFHETLGYIPKNSL